MIDSGNTLTMAARSLKENGASAIHALISHGKSVLVPRQVDAYGAVGLFSEARMDILQDLPLDSLVVRGMLTLGLTACSQLSGYEYCTTKAPSRRAIQARYTGYLSHDRRKHSAHAQRGVYQPFIRGVGRRARRELFLSCTSHGRQPPQLSTYIRLFL